MNDPVPSMLVESSVNQRVTGCGAIRMRTVLLVLVFAVVLVGLRSYWLWTSPPVYWQQHQEYLRRTTAEERLAMAQSVEQRILSELSFTSAGVQPEEHRQGPESNAIQSVSDGRVVEPNAGSAVKASSTRTVFLTIDEVNAWVDQRLRDWASNQGSTIPDYVSDPMVAIEGDHFVFAFRFDRPKFKQVISAVSAIEIEQGANGQSGQARVRIVKIRSGRLRVPGVNTVSGAIRKGAGASSQWAEMASKITEAFDGQVFDPMIKINHQKIRIVSFKLQHKPAGVKLRVKPHRS